MLMEKRQGIFQGMTDAINLSLSLLIDGDHPNAEGKPDHLILDKEEIIDLLDYLHTRFPALEDSRRVERPGEFAKQAALIQAFLAGGYRPAGLP
jgi:hypothetical protein